MIDLEKDTYTLNELISSGKTLEAMEQFYHEQVQMQENEEPPRIGKQLCMTQEAQNIASTKNVVCKLLRQAINNTHQVVFSEWEITFTNQNNITQRLSEVAVQQWENGKIINEKFYYKGFKEVI